MHWAKESEKPPSLTFQIRLRVVQKEGGRWEFRFCGFGEFLVRFLVFAFKIAVFRFWCSVRFAGFLQFCLWFSVFVNWQPSRIPWRGFKIELWCTRTARRHEMFHIFHFLQFDMVLGIIIPFREKLMPTPVWNVTRFPVNLHYVRTVKLDQYQYLGNSAPTPPLTQQ